MDTNTPQDQGTGKTQDPAAQNAQGAADAGATPIAGTPPAGGAATVGTQTGAGTGQAAAAKDDKFNIPEIVLSKYPELVELIKKTESMSDEERQYWFQILPIMTEDQVVRLRKILAEEDSQLTKLDDQYQDELNKLNKKHLDEWSAFEKQQEREARQAAESQAEKEEVKAEAAILEELESVDEKPAEEPPAAA